MNEGFVALQPDLWIECFDRVSPHCPEFLIDQVTSETNRMYAFLGGKWMRVEPKAKETNHASRRRP